MKKTKDKILKTNKGSINYPVGDFLIRLKNAAMASRTDVVLVNSKLINGVCEALKKEGFIDGVKEKDGKRIARLSYMKKEPVLLDVKLVSKPGLRMYKGVEELQKKKGHGVLILSTPLGVMSGKDAIKKKVGGEVIAEIF